MAGVLATIHDVHNGRAVVICNSRFNQLDGLDDIDFSNDMQLANDLLENLHINQKQHEENQTIERMISIMKDVAENTSQETDCLVCVLLSHGKTMRQEGFDKCHDAIYAKDGPVLLEDLMNIWKCDKLIGKPKIFIVIACRGRAWSESVAVTAQHPVAVTSQHPVDVTSQHHQEPRRQDEPSTNLDNVSDIENPGLGPGEMGNPASAVWTSCIPGDIPVSKDFILIHTTQPGFAAPRPMPGRLPHSPLLKALVDQSGKLRELRKIVTYALNDVAYGYGESKKKLMPWVASRLTKDIRFGKR